MRTCSLIIALMYGFLLSWAAPSGAAQEGMRSFILNRGGQQFVERWADTTHTVNECTSTGKYLLCIQSERVPAYHKNPRFAQVELRTLSLQARHRLYVELAKQADHEKFRQKKSAEETYLAGVTRNDTRYVLNNVEFFTGHDDAWYGAVAAVPFSSAIKTVSDTYKTKHFSDNYSDTLYPMAQRLFDDGKYEESLILLKEIHELKRARADAYILAAKAFLRVGKKQDASLIALEVFKDLNNQLTSTLAEELGDIFFELEDVENSTKAYHLASKMLNTNGR